MSRRALRVDAHQHFWDLSTGRYDWPTAAEAPIYRTFAPAELHGEIKDAGIDATLVVQATDTLADTDSMLAAARDASWIAGVVGWIPLRDPAAAEAALEPRRPALNGIRHLIHREADPDWLVRDDVAAGLALLEREKLPFDVVAVFPDHLRLVPVVADRHPGLTLVIDHVAKPPIRAEGWDMWRDQLIAAAERPNVMAKVSGLDTAAGPGWTPDELRPAFEVGLEAFGADRLMFGSDWPVCRLVSTYREVADAARTLVAGLSASEQDLILGGTASRVYGLG